jgi:aminoglycoside phosphotransferase (APT) family kinase protein
VSVAARRDPAKRVGTAAVPTPPNEVRRVFKGHSGARVVLHSTGSHSFVRKTAGNPSSNARLLSQMEKQRQLSQTGVPLPRMLASGTDEAGRAYFDMAYVPGLTVAQAVLEATVFNADVLVSAIERMFWLFRACSGEPISADQFRHKIVDIARHDRGATNVPSGPEAIRNCADVLLRLDWSGIPSSPSHGDLTLENIMLRAGRSVVFIDCDQAWVSSYWLDFGKLFQDVYGHWCLRNSYKHGGPQLANAKGKLEQLAGAFETLAAREDPALTAKLRQLAALNLFRALPYAVEADIASFIYARVLHLLGA